MIRENNHFATARIAFCAALLCGTSATFAQDASVAPIVETAPSPVSAPIAAQPAPEVASVVAPPPAVATIPEKQLLKPSVAKRQVPRPIIARATPVRSEVVPTAVGPTTAPVSPTIIPAAPTDENLPAATTMENTPGAAPKSQTNEIAPDDANDDNLIVVGGIVAALGLAGTGLALARRRRRPTEPYTATERTETVAPDVPVAPTFATRVSSAEPMRPAVVEHAAPRFVSTATDSNLPPLTDPLFAHRAELGPVTDPLFSHENELQPVTDPMFSDHEEYAGKAAGSAFDNRRTWPAAQPQRELEPAE